MSSTIAPLSGWMLKTIVELDQYRPGFAGAYLRSSNERRQVIAAACAVQRDQEVLREDADFLLNARHHILAKAYRRVPTGLRGALARAGAQPHDKRFYSILARTLNSPSHARIVQAINQLPSIDLTRLCVLRMLPPEVCTPGVVEAVDDVRTTKDAVALIELLVISGVDRHALATAITAVSDKRQLGRLWDRWAARCVFPAQPVQSSAGYHSISNGVDLREMVRRYRNCSMRYLVDVLNGFSAFGEFSGETDNGGMVVHLRFRADQWEIEDFYGKFNSRPGRAERERATQFLVSAGIVERPVVKNPSGPWDALRRINARWMYEVDDDG
jgi:hypothetical protein